VVSRFHIVWGIHPKNILMSIEKGTTVLYSFID